MNNRKYVQAQPFSLAGSGTSLGDVTFALSSFNTIDGVALTMSDFGTKGFGTLEPGAQGQEESISFTGLTTNTDGSVNLTGVSSVGFTYPYTETSGLQKIHAGGVVFVLTDTAAFYADFANTNDTATINQAWTFSTTPILPNNPVANTDAANKQYVDGVAVSGAPNANETTKGIVQLATNAQMGTATTSGSTGARLIPPNDQLTSTSAGAGSANKIPTLGATGVLDQTMLGGNRTWSGVQSLTADNCQITTDPDTANDAVRYSKAQSMTSGNEGTGTSGEAITVGSAIYMKASDGKLYNCIGTSDEPTYSFVGVALDAAGGSGTTIRYAKFGGIATGVATGTIGYTAFITDFSGAIGTAPGTRYAAIGIYLTTTSIQVYSPKFIRRGSQTITTNTTYTQTCGFYPKKIEIRAIILSTNSTGNESNDICFTNETTTGGVAGYAWCVKPGTQDRGTVSSRTQTGFVLTSVDRNGSDNYVVYWEAEN